MPKYQVTIYEVLAHTVDVEADDTAQAVAEARAMVRDGDYGDQIAVESLGEIDYEPMILWEDGMEYFEG